MTQLGVLAAADAIYDAEQSLQRAMQVLDDVSDLAASSLQVLDDAAIDSFHAHQENGRQFYLESAGENLARLRTRSHTLSDLGEDLGDHLGETSRALERAGAELDGGADDHDREPEVQALRTQIAVLREVLELARPLAEQIGRHARHAAVCAEQTDALMLLDTRVHDAGRNVSRADEGVSMMRAVIVSAQSRARTSAALAGSLSYPTTQPCPPQRTHQPDKQGNSGIAI